MEKLKGTISIAPNGNDSFRITIWDEKSWLAFLEIDVSEKDLVNILLRNHWIACWEYGLGNMDKINKTRESKTIDYPIACNKKEWIKEQEVDCFEYRSDTNYWSSALFIRFI